MTVSETAASLPDADLPTYLTTIIDVTDKELDDVIKALESRRVGNDIRAYALSRFEHWANMARERLRLAGVT